MARKRFLLLSLLSILASNTLSWAQPPKPVTVSPGSREGSSVIAQSCPTFSWGAIEGAASYEVVVYELSEEASLRGEEASPVIRKSLPGTVFSWTPSLVQCLEPGRQYEWYIRAEEEFEGDVWSEGRFFEVEERPSFREVRGALRVLKRYLEERGEEDALSELEWLDREERGEEVDPGAVASLSDDLPPMPTSAMGGVPKVADPLPVADWGGTSAIVAELSATTGETHGVVGVTNSTFAGSSGIYGEASATSGITHGVHGDASSTLGRGVYGRASATSGSTYGVYGQSDSDSGFGIYAWASATTGTTYAVYGEVDSSSGYAGYFEGNTHVDGTLTKTAGSFKIDHPLEPAKKYLYHSFVESPDMMNIYNGNVSLDKQGEAQVELPAWFEALNRDFRYQVTTVGGFAPVYISERIQDNLFKIAGGESGMVVSWQVTGIRRDAWAEAHPISVEEDKPEKEVGTYLHPEELGFDKTLGLDYQRNTALRKPLGAEIRRPAEKR